MSAQERDSFLLSYNQFTRNANWTLGARRGWPGAASLTNGRACAGAEHTVRDAADAAVVATRDAVAFRPDDQVEAAFRATNEHFAHSGLRCAACTLPLCRWRAGRACVRHRLRPRPPGARRRAQPALADGFGAELLALQHQPTGVCMRCTRGGAPHAGAGRSASASIATTGRAWRSSCALCRATVRRWAADVRRSVCLSVCLSATIFPGCCVSVRRCGSSPVPCGFPP